MSTFDPHRYTITIKLVTLEEGAHFEAIVAELPDLVVYGETFDQAYMLASESIADLAVAAHEQGRPFPAPMPSAAALEFSGRVTLRMAKSLHATASKHAELDGVSLNSWIVEAIAARAGGGFHVPAAASVYSAASIQQFARVMVGQSYRQPIQGTTWASQVISSSNLPHQVSLLAAPAY